MHKTLFPELSKTIGVGLLAGITLIFASIPSKAEDKVLPPPYELAGASGVDVSVVWDAAAIRKALPPGIKPAKGMTGGINIYSVKRGYGIGPYSAAYFYADVEGFDSPQGIKGRWLLAGVYGPQAKTSAALRTYLGEPVRRGTSRIERTAGGKRAIGTVNGHDFVAADFKPAPGSCKPAAVLINYLSLYGESHQIGVVKIPAVFDSCKAELMSVTVTAQSGDPFSAFEILKVTGAGEFKNGSFAFLAPQPAGK